MTKRSRGHDTRKIRHEDTYPVWAAAQEYMDRGISLFPVNADGTRRPGIRWKPYQRRRPTRGEVKSWFQRESPPGIGLLVGPVSGNLVAFDFDDAPIYHGWKAAVKQRFPKTWAKFVIVRSPSGGRHIYFRCDDWIDCKIKLAVRCPDGDRPDAAIEFYQERHFLAAPGSPLGMHRLHKPYTVVSERDFAELQTISAKRVRRLVEIARSFDERPAKPEHKISAGRKKHCASDGNCLRPGDDFNARATWEEILEPHGWIAMRNSDDTTYWRRPGKNDESHSATTNHLNSDLLHVFSSTADPFEPDYSYTTFSAYALLNHGEDFHAAADDLRRRGYGKAIVRHAMSARRIGIIRAAARKARRRLFK